ncbi:hypothetical protein [uncultured Kocuria sp.]|uniref:hypothetical protein n=1 Tax=uncultured Kocuria sp. TaxID=259305 RepID=UPI0025918669|nr:hypothetical protein [uncultured Kocuria sp.]MCT1367589.1 hypothetical protein [Rothia sp. p3-SID1597]
MSAIFFATHEAVENVGGSQNGIGVGVAATNAEAHGNIVQSAATTPNGQISEEQFQHTMRVLDQLPEDLKTADPKTTPNYEQRLTEAINKIEGAESSGVTTYVNWISCGAALAGVVAQYGIPVGKVVKWLKDGYKIFGGIKGLIAAIRSGAAIAEIGEDAVKVLEGILGVDGVVTACS